MPAPYRSTAKYSKQRLLRAPENLSKVGRLVPDRETRKYEPKWGNLPSDWEKSQSCFYPHKIYLPKNRTCPSFDSVTPLDIMLVIRSKVKTLSIQPYLIIE